jgi:hypothetical protein
VIHVEAQPEPDDFDELVRRPGRSALETRRPELPPYWRACLPELRRRYRDVCAYLCVFIPPGTGAPSTEHFAPKSKNRELAYEWSNYRLVCTLMNARKREFEDVLDPFEIPDGLFELDLSFLQVTPSPGLDQPARERVQATIDRLGLNDQECIDARAVYYNPFVEGQLTLELLDRWSPFVARAWRVQNNPPQP